MHVSKLKWWFAAAVVVAAAFLLYRFLPAADGTSKTPAFPAQLDTHKSYAILATEQAAAEYGKGIAVAKQLHPKAWYKEFTPERIGDVEAWLFHTQPYYALIFITPSELDINLAWRWLRMSTRLDDDVFVDVRTGFITGRTPQAVLRLMQRIQGVAEGSLSMPAVCIDNLSVNTAAAKRAFQKVPGSYLIPVLAQGMEIYTISHGRRGFSQDRLSSMSGAGMLHLGGHGFPDRIVDTLNGPWINKLILNPCVIFNGACYTGVTGRWFDITTAALTERSVDRENAFSLAMLANQAVAYLAALHADHGIPVYQEMEYLAFEGCSLGDIIKHTHDSVILANQGQLPSLPLLAGGMASPFHTPAQIMLAGTASRVLFGDPSLVLLRPFTDRPFDITITPAENELLVTASLKNTHLKATYTDTFFSDLTQGKAPFNDRALISFALPDSSEAVTAVEVVGVSANGSRLSGSLKGYAVEQTRERLLLHVQIDLPASGYMTSAFRKAGSIVEIKVLLAAKAST